MPLRVSAATEQLGRRHALQIHQPGNLPLIGTGTGNCPNHEELVVLNAAALAVSFAALFKSLSSKGKTLFSLTAEGAGAADGGNTGRSLGVLFLCLVFADEQK